MAEFTAKDVMKLREQTGAGMMDCKRALVDADGDLYTAGFTPKKRNELLSAKAVDEICALVEAGEEVHAWLVGAAMLAKEKV